MTTRQVKLDWEKPPSVNATLDSQEKPRDEPPLEPYIRKMLDNKVDIKVILEALSYNGWDHEKYA